MLLRLIVAILWVTTSQVDAQITNCLHDGFLNSNSSCICKNGFSSSQCQVRACFNDGQLLTLASDLGCICPAGFLGSNCEPTKCTTGEAMFYEDVSDQTISMFITQNNQLLNDTATDPTVNTICSFFNNATEGQYKQLQFSLGGSNIVKVFPSSKCIDLYNEYALGDDDDPPLNTLSTDLENVETLLDATPPNSLYFLIVNYPADNNTVDAVPRIIRKAVSKRIRIHVVAYRIPNMISDYHEYVNPGNVGYQALRVLAESTLGSFITPYWGTAHQTLGPDNANTAVQKLLDMRSNGFEPAAFLKTSGSPLVSMAVTDKYYISIRTEDNAFYPAGQPILTFSPGPDLNNASCVSTVDTGYWKLYEITTTATSVQLFLNNANFLNTAVDYIVYTQRPDYFPAVTNNIAIDAAAPYKQLTDANKMLVAHGHRPDIKITSAKVYSSAYSTMNYTVGKAALITKLQTRDCQFNTYIGDLTCTDEGGIFIQTVSSDGTNSVFPFFCVGGNSNSSTTNYAVAQSFEGLLDETTTAAPRSEDCQQPFSGPSLNLEEGKNVQRAFTILSRNVRYLINTVDKIQAQNYSTVDQLYYNEDNIFNYLMKQKDVYSNYYAYLLNPNSTGTETPAAGNDLYNFMNQLMDKTKSADDNSTTQDNPVQWSAALKTAANFLRNNGKMYTDIFMVIDLKSNLDGFYNDNSIFDSLYKTRSKLFLLTVETRGEMMMPVQYGSPGNDTFQLMAKTAAQTGGGLYRFSDFANLRQFFDLYFQKNGLGLIGSDVVYQKMTNTAISRFSTDPINLPELLDNVQVSYKIAFYSTMSATSISTCNGSLTNSTIFGEMQIFDISYLAGQTNCNFTVSLPPPQAQALNFMIYVTGVNDRLPYNADIGFSSALKVDVSSDGYKLQFANTNPQFPVVSSLATNIQIKNSSNLEVINLEFSSGNSSGILERTGCSDFKSFVQYDFKCSKANDYYYFYSTFNDSNGLSHNRAFVTRCLSSGDNSCMNGGTNSNCGICNCPVGWTGDICQTPLCQNGGTVLSSGQCSCQSKFSGVFCEYAIGVTCTNSDGIPDIRSEITTVLFVVEKTDTNFNITVKQDFPGIQFSVVQFDSNSFDTVYIGTEAKKLPAKLATGTGNVSDPVALSDNSGLAIKQALDTQLESRALLIYLTQTCSNPFGQSESDILTRLASQRVDVRVYSGRIADDALNKLALYGNGIVFQSGNWKTDFEAYFTSYFTSLFQIQFAFSVPTLNSIPQLSVIQTGSFNSGDKISVNADPADSTTRTVYYVHVSTGAVQAASSSATVTNVSIGSNSKITSFKLSAIANIDFSFTGTGFYSIEKLTTVKLSYGFQESGTDENLRTELRLDQNNTLSFYSSQSTINNRMDSGSYPYVIIAEILSNGSIGPDVPFLATRKPDGCKYSYYTEPINCTNGTVGYVAKFHTITGGAPVERVEQKILLCSTVISTTTTQATSTQATSTVRLTTTTTAAPSGPRAFAFIVDVYGGDPNLYNKVIDTINFFLAAYDKTVKVLFVEQTGTLINANYMSNGPAALAKLNSTAFYNRTQIDVNNNTDLTAALTAITANVSDELKNNRVFFLTQTGVVNQTYDWSSLQAKNFTFNAVFYLNTNGTNYTTERYQSLQKYLGVSSPNSLLVTNNTAEAVAFLERNAGADDNQIPSVTPAAPRKYSCVKNSQASIFVSFENSNTTGNGVDDVQLTQAFKEFFNYFPSDFELGDQFTYKQYPNTSYDGNGCNVNLNRFEGVTQMSGWAVSGKKISTTPNLCYNNYGSVGPYIIPNNQATTSILFESLAGFFNTTFSQPCKCTRQDHPDILKTVVWLVYNKPAYNTTIANTLVKNFTSNDNFLHIVVGFGNAAKPVDGDFYYVLAHSNIEKLDRYPPYPVDMSTEDFLIDGSGAELNYSGKDIVAKVWTVICRLQSLLSSGETARPPTQTSDAFFMRFMQAQADGLAPPDRDPLEDVTFVV